MLKRKGVRTNETHTEDQAQHDKPEDSNEKARRKRNSKGELSTGHKDKASKARKDQATS